MNEAMRGHLQERLGAIRAADLYKRERVITTPQQARIGIEGGRQVLNLCANNYLGLADHPDIIAAARASYQQWGYGLSSVRFICGTQSVHRQLEEALSQFLGTEETILYTSCFDANGGLFETLLGEEDAVLSDELNHASIIDGIRLCKAQRLRFQNGDMADLEAKLKEAAAARFRLNRHRRRVFPWMALSPSWARYAIWPNATTPWSWSTIRTRWALSARRGGARTSTVG